MIIDLAQPNTTIPTIKYPIVLGLPPERRADLDAGLPHLERSVEPTCRQRDLFPHRNNSHEKSHPV